MFPNESNPYFKSDLSQASADSVAVHFIALQSSEPATSSRKQQITEQRESDIHQVRPVDFFGLNLVWLLPIWGAIVWLLLLGTASEAWKLVRSNTTTVKQGQRVPCRNCRYFSNNFYLKCAVRPSDALTERATDCSDFCQKTDPEESKPQTKRIMRH
jgi:hypothetical protein